MKEMKHEVLHDTSMQDDMAKAKRRRECMVMTPHEAMLYCEAPNAARGNDHPAYPDDDYGDTR